MESELPEQIPTNNQPGGKKNASNPQQIEASYPNKGVKTFVAAIFHDDFFRLLTSISIGCWMIHEYIFDVHKIFLLAGIVFTLADAFYVLGHKILIQRWWMRFLCWVTYTICIIFIFISKNEPESTPPSFFVKTFFANIGIGHQTQKFLLWEYKTKALTPINIEMLIQLVNLKSDPLKIYSCQFEGKNTNGNWEIFPMIDRRYGDLAVHDGNYWGVQNPNENPDPYKTYFPAVLDNKILGSEPITGYVLLEIPKDAVADSLRLRLFVAGDLEIAENINLHAETNHLQTQLHDSLPMTTYRPATNNMSEIPIVPYSFIHKE
jgi:hypothetical protein